MSEKQRTVIFIIATIVVAGGLFAIDAFASKGICEVMLEERFTDCSTSSRIDYISSHPVEAVIMTVRAIFLGLIAAVAVTVFADRLNSE